jgi:hypothetical protein
MKIAISPQFYFPYIPYFQLISSVDKFIFFDDITYVKQSWLNRNRLLLNGQDKFFTIPLENRSSFKLIYQTNIKYDPIVLNKMHKTFQQAYVKAPFFNDIMPIIETSLMFMKDEHRISKIAAHSVELVCKYLNINTRFEFSCELYSHTKGIGRNERLYQILQENKATDYYNLPGGVNLYTKEEFKKQGLNLHFMQLGDVKYKQFNNDFVPWLSILDVLMFNSKTEVLLLMKKCKPE